MNNADLNRQQAVQLVETLTTLGLRHAVLSPGARNTPLMLALHDAASSGAEITLHSVIDERAAAFYALGIARQTDQPVLLSCTSGSAAANYFPAVVEASEGMVPLFVATADRPAELQDCGAPQAMNQVGLFGVHVRADLNVEAPEADRSSAAFVDDIRHLWTAATGIAPGPVHINLRFRKPLWRADSPVVITPPVSSPTPHNDSASEADIARFMADTRGHRGVIVVGPDPSARLDSEAIRALSDWLGWPILADPVSQLRFGSSVEVVHHHDAMLRSAPFRDAHPFTMAVCLGGTSSSRPLEELLGAHVAAGGGAGREGGERDEAVRKHGGADVCGQGLGKAKSCLPARRCARGQPKLGLGEVGNSDEVLLVQLVSSSVVRRGRRAAHWRCWDYLRAAPMICKPGELASVLLNASYWALAPFWPQ